MPAPAPIQFQGADESLWAPPTPQNGQAWAGANVDLNPQTYSLGFDTPMPMPQALPTESPWQPSNWAPPPIDVGADPRLAALWVERMGG